VWLILAAVVCGGCVNCPGIYQGTQLTPEYSEYSRGDREARREKGLMLPCRV